MGNPSQDELYPQSIVFPQFTSAVRNTLLADVGTVIFNSTTNKFNFCKTKAAAATSWEELTSVEEA